MKSFKSFLSEAIPPLNDLDGSLVEIPIGESMPPDCIFRIFIWQDIPIGKPLQLDEVFGNRKQKLIGQYHIRYDPPRTASTAANTDPVGDWHLFDRRGEIAAWSAKDGTARHGFPSGQSIPKKAYAELNKLYPDKIGINGPYLEYLARESGSSSFLV